MWHFAKSDKHYYIISIWKKHHESCSRLTRAANSLSLLSSKAGVPPPPWNCDLLTNRMRLKQLWVSCKAKPWESLQLLPDSHGALPLGTELPCWEMLPMGAPVDSPSWASTVGRRSEPSRTIQLGQLPGDFSCSSAQPHLVMQNAQSTHRTARDDTIVVFIFKH